MAKPELREPFASLESDLFATMQAGLHEWRADLDYPESYSDFQACFRALFRMYEVKRRPLAIRIEDIETPEPTCPWCGVQLRGQDCAHSGKNTRYMLCDACGKKLRGERP